MVRCVCGADKCPINIVFDDASHILWFTDKNNNDCPMYLDANATVELINRLKRFLGAFYLEDNE